MLSSNVLSQVFIVKCYSKSLLLRLIVLSGYFWASRTFAESIANYTKKKKNKMNANNKKKKITTSTATAAAEKAATSTETTSATKFICSKFK